MSPIRMQELMQAPMGHEAVESSRKAVLKPTCAILICNVRCMHAYVGSSGAACQQRTTT